MFAFMKVMACMSTNQEVFCCAFTGLGIQASDQVEVALSS
jgi:hypothetical protein